ncbi:MAG TPA: DUF4468 domain-containing protein [Bacteroidia bacterium]|nr:DUF4468 domain-containing protein [Bacteroidia bacterium]
MIKPIFILLAAATVLIAAPSFAQKSKEEPVQVVIPKDKDTGLYSYSGVVDVSGTTKDELYNRAIAWVQLYYKNPGDVLREKDPASGKMVIKARFKIYNPADKKGLATDAGDVMYTLTIQFKDGKYRYELTRFTWMLTSAFAAERWADKSSSSYKSEFDHYLTQTDAKASEVLLALKKGMTTSPEKKKDDW